MKKKHVQMGLLVLVFLVPPLLSYVLFYSGYRPEGSINHGELVTPARPVDSDEGMNTLEGDEFRFAGLPKKWTLFYLGGSRCDSACDDSLYKIQQIRLTQGREMGRVRSIAVVPEDTAPEAVEKMSTAYPGVEVILASETTHAGLTYQFQQGDDAPLQGSGRIYIVDPIGNIMMSYPPEADPTGMKKDLKRLLKVSKLG